MKFKYIIFVENIINCIKRLINDFLYISGTTLLFSVRNISVLHLVLYIELFLTSDRIERSTRLKTIAEVFKVFQF
jgi:hypothetical protein